MKSFTKTILGLILLVCVVGTFPSSLASGEGWLTGWGDRKLLVITNSTGAGTDYQVYLNVSYRPTMQVDFDDLRFTEDDGDTLLDHWLEYKIDSSFADVWVRVTDNLTLAYVDIYMYYGNVGASSSSNGTATMLFFDDFENNDLDRWTFADTAWSTTAAQAARGTYSGYADSGSNTVMWYEFAAKIEYGIMIHEHVRFQTAAGEEYPITAYEEDSTLIYVLYAENNDWATYDGVDIKYYDLDTQLAEAWYRFEVGFDYVGELFYPYLDRVLKTTQDLDSSDSSAVVTDVFRAGSSASNTGGNDQWIDDYYVRKWVVSEPTVIWGTWDVVNIAELIFPVEWDPVAQFGFNMAFVMLGLIMIPTSSIYLAYGIKHDRSSDRLFYGLIIFLMGCGLFIGGILP